MLISRDSSPLKMECAFCRYGECVGRLSKRSQKLQVGRLHCKFVGRFSRKVVGNEGDSTELSMIPKEEANERLQPIIIKAESAWLSTEFIVAREM